MKNAIVLFVVVGLDVDSMKCLFQSGDCREDKWSLIINCTKLKNNEATALERVPCRGASVGV